MLAKVIKAAKKLHDNRIISNSENKMKTTLRIINEEKGKPKHDSGIQSLMLNNKLISNQKEIADSFNIYFITIADSILVNNNNNKHSANTVNPITYLRDIIKSPFSKMTWKYTSTHEVEKVIKSLKSKDSSGYEETTSRIIKVSSPFISSPLTHIWSFPLQGFET
jgi:hypothetical protein